MPTLDEFVAQQKALQEQQEALANQAREVIVGGFKAIFDEYPQLTSVRWTQYTPYFNDGDECVFSANTDYFKMNVVIDEDGDDDGEGSEEWEDFDYQSDSYTGEHSNMNEPYKKTKSFLSNFSEANLKAAFGDHCEVVITKDGVDIEGYDHD